MIIIPTKEDCKNELDRSRFENVDVSGVHIQFGIVPDFDEVVVVATDGRVFRAMYIPSRGIASIFKLVEGPKKELEVK